MQKGFLETVDIEQKSIVLNSTEKSKGRQLSKMFLIFGGSKMIANFSIGGNNFWREI